MAERRRLTYETINVTEKVVANPQEAAVDEFAAEAERFVAWAMNGSDSGHAAAMEALRRIQRLYLAGLALPPAWDPVLAGEPDEPGIGRDEVRAVGQACRRLPLDLYGEVFDPLSVPPEQPVIGSLVDDIQDIYADVAGGLRAYRGNRRAQAVWEWRFNLQIHWGEHATGAIRALHCWLAANGFDPVDEPDESPKE